MVKIKQIIKPNYLLLLSLMLSLLLISGCSNTNSNINNNLSANHNINGSEAENEDNNLTINNITKGVGSDSTLSKEEIIKKYSKGSDVSAEILSDALYPKKNELITIKFKSKNKGHNKVQSPYKFIIQIKNNKDEIIYHYENISSTIIEPNKEELLNTWSHSFKEFGTYTVELNLDPLNQLKELKENNNIKIIKIKVNERSTSKEDDSNSESSSSEEECSDSDGGLVYGTVGTCTDNKDFKKGKTDFCTGQGMIGELYCNAQNHCDIKIKMCEHVCRDGACI